MNERAVTTTRKRRRKFQKRSSLARSFANHQRGNKNKCQFFFTFSLILFGRFVTAEVEAQAAAAQKLFHHRYRLVVFFVSFGKRHS